MYIKQILIKNNREYNWNLLKCKKCAFPNMISCGNKKSNMSRVFGVELILRKSEYYCTANPVILQTKCHLNYISNK